MSIQEQISDTESKIRVANAFLKAHKEVTEKEEERKQQQLINLKREFERRQKADAEEKEYFSRDRSPEEKQKAADSFKCAMDRLKFLGSPYSDGKNVSEIIIERFCEAYPEYVGMELSTELFGDIIVKDEKIRFIADNTHDIQQIGDIIPTSWTIIEEI